MSDQSKLGLGQIITTEQHRDAIHVAVAPVVAAQRIYPGDHLQLDKDGKAFGFRQRTADSIGVADPFLDSLVHEGETFWLFLYPGSITSLRHEWTHPAFTKAQPASLPPAMPDKSESEKWMRAWAVANMGYDYYGDSPDKNLSEETAYANAIQAGHRNHIGPYESAREHIDNEWWNHWEILTGQRGDRDTYFSCSC